MANLNRRRFLGAAIGTGAVAAAAGSWAPAATAQGGAPGSRRTVPSNRIGIQLYTMREVMGNSGDRRAVRRVLNFLGSIGYTEVELAGYAGFTATQFRGLVDEAGLRAVAGHDGVNIDPANTTWQAGYQQTLDNANTMGQKYTGLAWFPPPYDNEDFWHFLAERLNEAGALAKAEGLQFYYHNHNFEFENKQANGRPLYDIFLEETDPELVKFELDLFWITEGGASAVDYLSADPGRYIGYHVKDHVWGDRPNAADYHDVGPTGMLDFPDLFDAGDGRGDKHFFIEHDEPWLSHTGDEDANAEYLTAKAGITYLQQVRW
jgi:sugar phosphate isomerase/epimerase